MASRGLHFLQLLPGLTILHTGAPELEQPVCRESHRRPALPSSCGAAALGRREPLCGILLVSFWAFCYKVSIKGCKTGRRHVGRVDFAIAVVPSLLVLNPGLAKPKPCKRNRENQAFFAHLPMSQRWLFRIATSRWDGSSTMPPCCTMHVGGSEPFKTMGEQESPKILKTLRPQFLDRSDVLSRSPKLEPR